MFDDIFFLDTPICMCSSKVAECMYMSVARLYGVHMDMYYMSLYVYVPKW
jgi:hypothetical protein